MSYLIKDAYGGYWNGVDWTSRQSDAKRFETVDDADDEIFALGGVVDFGSVVKLKRRLDGFYIRDSDGLYLLDLELMKTTGNVDNLDSNWTYKKLDAVRFLNRAAATAMCSLLDAINPHRSHEVVNA